MVLIVAYFLIVTLLVVVVYRPNHTAAALPLHPRVQALFGVPNSGADILLVTAGEEIIEREFDVISLQTFTYWDYCGADRGGTITIKLPSFLIPPEYTSYAGGRVLQGFDYGQVLGQAANLRPAIKTWAEEFGHCFDENDNATPKILIALKYRTSDGTWWDKKFKIDSERSDEITSSEWFDMVSLAIDPVAGHNEGKTLEDLVREFLQSRE